MKNTLGEILSLKLVNFPPESVALADELRVPLVGSQVDGQGHDLQVDLDK